MEPVKLDLPCHWPPSGEAAASDTRAPLHDGHRVPASDTLPAASEGGTPGETPCQRLQRASAALWSPVAGPGPVRGDFRGLPLDRACFAGAALYGADFRDARLREADFRGARLLAVRFDGADLSHADLRDLDTPWANFSGSVLHGAAISFGPRALQRMGEMSFLSAVVQSTASIADEFVQVRASMVRQIFGELQSRMAPGSAPLSPGVKHLLAGHRLFRDDPAASELIGRAHG
nr:pentapeptide repeat-containing protein [Cupriavidus sp. AU9028]